MTEEKRAELYTSPGGKFIRADTLPRVLPHWRSMRSAQKQSHFIKYDGELYVGEEIDNLQVTRGLVSLRTLEGGLIYLTGARVFEDASWILTYKIGYFASSSVPLFL